MSSVVVSRNSVVMENHVSVLATVAPNVDPMKSTLWDSEEGRKNVVLNTRPTVQFEFGIGKKSLGS